MPPQANGSSGSLPMAPKPVCVRRLAAKSMDFIALQGRGGACLNDIWPFLQLTPEDIHLPQLLWHVWVQHRWQLEDSAVQYTLKLMIRAVGPSEEASKQKPVPDKDFIASKGKGRRKPRRGGDVEDTSKPKRRKPSKSSATRKAAPQQEQAQMLQPPSESLVDKIFPRESWRDCSWSAFQRQLLDQSVHLTQCFLVACEDLRHRAMNISARSIAAELNSDHLQILELIGKARHHGTTIPELSQQLTDMPIKKLHTMIDTLLSYRLMVKRMIVVVKPVMKRMNILHLPRFASHFDPKMYAKSATFETDDQERRLLLATAEMYLLKQPGRVSVMSDLGRDLGLDRRKQETLRNVVLQEGKRDEFFPFELFQAVLERTEKKLEPRILNCIRYIGRNGSKGNSEEDGDARSGIVHELGLLHQLFQAIEKRGQEGATVMDMREDISIPGSKLPYRLVTVLAKTYGLKGDMILMGKNKVFRLFVPERLKLEPSSESYVAGRTPMFEQLLSSASAKPASERIDLASAEEAGTASNQTAITEISTSEHNAESAERPMIQALERRSSSIDDLNEGSDSRPAPSSPSWAPHNYNLSKALDYDAQDVTLKKRRAHIMQRLQDERIISLYSLRASIFAMERHEPCVAPFQSSTKAMTTKAASCITSGIDASRNSMGGHTVGIIDVRSLQRIVTHMESEKKLHFMELPFPGQNVSTKLRKLRCVVLAGHKDDDKLLQHFVMNYGRQERLRRVYHNVGSNIGVRIREVSEDEEDDDDDDDEKGEASASSLVRKKHSRKKRRVRKSAILSDQRSDTMLNMTNQLINSTDNIPSIDYRYHLAGKALSATQLHYQYTALGFAYGVMFRCREFHRFLWKYHIKQQQQFDASTTITEDSSTSLVYARETVLRAMPVAMYIRTFSGGSVLSRDEMVLVRHVIAEDDLAGFDVLPPQTATKILNHEGKRAARVLGNLHDLGLLHPHTMRMQDLIRLVQQEFQDDSTQHDNGAHQSGFLASAIRENALEGLFKICTSARITFDDSPVQTMYATGELRPLPSSGESSNSAPSSSTAPLFSSQVNRAPVRRLSKEEIAIRKYLNEQKQVKIAGTTLKNYSFGLHLPLEFDFVADPKQVDLYWEVMECLCLEKELVMEIPSEFIKEQIPDYVGSLVCELPKPKRTRVRQQFKSMGWIQKTHRIKKAPPINVKALATNANLHIVSKLTTTRRSRKRKLNQSQECDSAVVETLAAYRAKRLRELSLVRPKRRRRKRDYKQTVRQREASLDPFAWSQEDSDRLVDLFLKELAQKWQLSIPCELRSEFHDDRRAYIGGSLAQTQGIAVAQLATALKKRQMDVRKRLLTSFEEPTVKRRIQQTARQLEQEYKSENTWTASSIVLPKPLSSTTAQEDNADGSTECSPAPRRGYRSILHHEEQAIMQSTRLSALFRRAVMMIMSPEEIYHPFVAEEMISYWQSEEIKLVWRYLFMRRWIVRAKMQEQRIRGFIKSRILRELLKITRVVVGYPLQMFCQTAQQQSFVTENLLEQDYEKDCTGEEEEVEDEEDKDSSAAVYAIQFPVNASAGFCAFQLTGQAMGTCDYRVAFHQKDASSTTKSNAKRVAAIAAEAEEQATTRRRKRPRLSGRGRPSREGNGVVAQIVSVSQAEDLERLMESWQVKTYNRLQSEEDRDRFLNNYRAFSSTATPWTASSLQKPTSRVAYPSPSERCTEYTSSMIKETIVELINKSGAEGLSETSLLEQLYVVAVQSKSTSKTDSLPNREAFDSEALKLLHQLLAEGKGEESPVLRVPSYDGFRLVSREHEKFWYLRRFTLETLPRGQTSTYEVTMTSDGTTTTHEMRSSAPLANAASRAVLQFESDRATVFAFPWLRMDGEVNYDFLFALQRRIIEMLMEFPGMSDVAIHRGLDRLLSLQDTREVLRLLIDNEVIYSRAMEKESDLVPMQATATFKNSTNIPRSSMDFFFGESNKTRPLSRIWTPNADLSTHRSSQDHHLGPVPVFDEVVLHYFPHVDCVQRFGNLVEDTQNEN